MAKQILDEGLRELVRIHNTDIEGTMNMYAGLTRIKGVSWGISNAVCKILAIDKGTKVGTLTDDEIKKVEIAIKNVHKELPYYMLNRPRGPEGAKHLIMSDMELQHSMEIRKLREIQSYRGIRHALGLPVRGQRTRSHFRRGRAVGVEKKKLKQKVGTKKPEGKK